VVESAGLLNPKRVKTPIAINPVKLLYASLNRISPLWRKPSFTYHFAPLRVSRHPGLELWALDTLRAKNWAARVSPGVGSSIARAVKILKRRSSSLAIWF